MRTGGAASIDASRGIATLLVLLHHAIAAEPVLSASTFAAVNDALGLVRMPLFMIVTGCLLGARPPGGGGERLYRLRKAIVRLVWPMIMVALTGVLLLRGQGVDWPIASALLLGSWHLWYLQALIWLKLAYASLDTVWRPSADQLIALSLAASLVAQIDVATGMVLFSLGRAVELLPFLLFGAWVGRKPSVLDARALPYLLYAVALSALVVRFAGHGAAPPLARTSWMAMLAGAGSGLWLLRHAPRFAALELVGRYAFPIFLWHLPWFAAADLLLLGPCHIAGALAVAIRVAVGLLLPALVVRGVLASGVVPIVLIGDAAPRRAPQKLPQTPAAGYRSALRRFAPGMNHPC
ncbi:acyltransferase family protein [uncultured Sphingomonas sp.]|uniref:acyltransferase family protein n=1 Tax=uncultured Sphingomonas sp. TaxID=158754 RepID=UPI0035CB395E